MWCLLIISLTVAPGCQLSTNYVSYADIENYKIIAYSCKITEAKNAAYEKPNIVKR